jgi:hypothetical protein
MLDFQSHQQSFEDYVLSVVGNCLVEGVRGDIDDLKGLASEVTEALLESRKILNASRDSDTSR